MRKFLSLLIVLLLISAVLPVALAEDDEITYPICPDCGNTVPDCICADMKPVSTPKATPAPHICSFGIYEPNGDGTHTVICSGGFYHRYTEKCYSDNNHNHKCDHCAYIMSEHEFDYVPEGTYSHTVSCYCGEEYTELCSFVNDKCEDCGNVCSIYTIDSKVLDELNNGSFDSISADSLRRDMLSIEYGLDESFRADISQQALDKIRSENSDIDISIGNGSVSMTMGADFLVRLDEGVYVESQRHDEGFAVELGSGDKMLCQLDTKGMDSHWGASALRCRLDCAPSYVRENSTHLLTLGMNLNEGSFAPIDDYSLSREKSLSKARYRLNTVDYPYAQTEYDRLSSEFSMLGQPQLNIRFDYFGDTEEPEAYIIIDGDDSYQLAPDDEGIYEADLLLAPGREIGFGLIDIKHF